MIDENIKRLIDAQLDGPLDGAEAEQLLIALAGSQEARDYQTGLLELDEMLSAMPVQQSRAALQQKIMDAIELPTNVAPIAAARDKRSSNVFRLGFAAAAAVLIGVVVMTFQQGDFTAVEVAGMAGTVAPKSIGDVVLDKMLIDSDGLKGSASLRHERNMLVLDVVIENESSFEAKFDFGTPRFAVNSTEPHNEQVEFFLEGGNTMRAVGFGPQKFSVLIRRQDEAELTESSVVSVEFLRDGSLIQQGTLSAY